MLLPVSPLPSLSSAFAALLLFARLIEAEHILQLLPHFPAQLPGPKNLALGAICPDEPPDLSKQGANADLHFVPLCRHRYRIIPVDVTGREPREALAQALPETAAEDVCRFVLTGESGEQGVDLPALETAFAPKCYVLQLRDQTRPTEDIWKRAGEDTLRGLFLQDLRQRWDAATDDGERRRIAQAVRFGLAALDGRDR